MNFIHLFSRFILVVLLGSFLGCISNKKHFEEIDILKANHKSEIDESNSEIAVAKAKNERLNLQLAERKGEINILLNIRQELYDTIAQMELALENIGNQSVSQQQDLNTELFQKQSAIKLLNIKLQKVDAVIVRHQETMEKLAFELNESVQEISENDVSIQNSYNYVQIILSESYFFTHKIMLE